MPFRSSFACLWCGTDHVTRTEDDLEGWAQLCPDCVGKAGDNGFLRFRLHRALADRAAARAAPSPEPEPGPLDREMIAYYAARAPEYDDWYLRRGRYEHGPIHDSAWHAELDAAGRWLDGLPIAGEIVELAAGTGWWSPLLASKGELSLYDASDPPLARARERLVAHGLRAHLHVRDAWDEPDRQVDAVFVGFWLSHVEPDRLRTFLALVLRWLKPGGVFAFIDSLDDPMSGASDRTPVADGVSTRRLADGRTFRVVKVYHSTNDLERALSGAGFNQPTVTTTGRFFVLGVAST